jgi:hypothetical protein
MALLRIMSKGYIPREIGNHVKVELIVKWHDSFPRQVQAHNNLLTLARQHKYTDIVLEHVIAQTANDR